MSAVLDLPDDDWNLVTLSGTWARERHVHDRALVPGRQSVGSLRGATGHEHSPFLALRRAATTEDAGEAIAVSLVYSGNFLAEAEVDPFGTTRLRIGIHPDAFAWRLEPGATFTTPGGDHRLVGRRPGRAERGLPRPVSRAAGARPVAGPPAPGRPQQLGGDLLRLRPRPDRGDRRPGQGPGRRAVRPRRRLVRAAGQRRPLARRLGRRPAQAARRPRGAGARRQGARPAVRPVDRARDGQRRQRPVPRPSRLGDRRPGPGADGEPAAARAGLRAPGGRRPHRGRADRGPLERAHRLRQVGHEPQHHRALDGRRARRTARARSSTATSSACTSCTGASSSGSRTSCSSPAPAAAGGSTPGCSRSRHRRGPATTPMPSSGWRSSGAPRSRSRCRRWPPTCRRCRTTRPGASRRCSPARRSRCSARSGTSWTRPRCPTADQAEVARQIAWYLDRREVLQLRPLPAAAEPVRGRRQRDGVDGGRRRTRSHAVVGFYRVLGHPDARPRTGSGCAASTLPRPTASPPGWTRSRRPWRPRTARATS